MGSTISCFLLEPVEEAEAFLRRFVFSSQMACSRAAGYHTQEVSIGRLPWSPPDPDLNGYAGDVPHDDPRWPMTCGCGYAFGDKDEWQVNIRRLHRRSDNGELVTIDKAPPGAMWYADWYPNMKGPDGRTLVVRTPAGDWIVDGPASNSNKPWTRTGTPPRVTAHPSIGMGEDAKGRWTYHGWLRDGVLVEC